MALEGPYQPHDLYNNSHQVAGIAGRQRPWPPPNRGWERGEREKSPRRLESLSGQGPLIHSIKIYWAPTMCQDAALVELSLEMKTGICPTNIHVSQNKLLGALKERNEALRASFLFLTV